MNRLPFIALLLATSLLVAADRKEAPPSAKQIQTWVKQLGDDDFKVREEATRKLIEAGEVAFDEVREATKSDDVEVRQRALMVTKQINKQRDKAAVAHNNRGLAWMNKAEHDKAIEEYNRAIQLNPKYASAFFNRGSAWLGKGEQDKAIEEYSKAIQLKPKEYNYYESRGNIWALKGNTVKSEADLKKAHELKFEYILELLKKN